MNRRVAIVLGLTFCALVAATVWVPVAAYRNYTMGPGPNPGDLSLQVGDWRRDPLVPGLYWQWVWVGVPLEEDPELTQGPYADVSPPGAIVMLEERVHWPWLAMEYAVIVALAGGLLTWVVRRERRRKAATA